MSKPLRIDLFTAKVPELLAALRRHDQESMFRWLVELIEAQQQRQERRAAKVKDRRGNEVVNAGKERPSQRGAWPTPKLRRVVWQRSGGRCENPFCGRRITWDTFEMDHFRGRARAPQTPENTWALCSDRAGGGCHQEKHAAKPSREHWCNAFLVHLRAHGFSKSETAQKVGAELEGQELIEKARAIRARQKAEASQRRCTPVWGSCAFPSGHAGPHSQEASGG